MSVMPYPDHLLSLDEWAALPEDNTHHYELVEGVLAVTPRPLPDHQIVIFELGYQLRTQLPNEFIHVPEEEVIVRVGELPTVRVPDLVVVPIEKVRQKLPRFQAADVLLAVEIISPGSRVTDQVTKLFDYADAGIPSYWIIDIEPPTTMTAYRLVDGEYELVGEGSGVLELSAPAPLEIDVDALTQWRRP